VTSLPIDWYAARAAGVVAYVLLTGVVLVGLTLSGRVQLPRWPKFAVTDVHRFGSLLVGVFVTLHVLTVGLDTYTRFSLTQLLVPFTSSYRPLWIAVGIVATELLVAIAVTNALRSRIPHRVWRRAHYATFLVWAGATVHGVGAGTDSRALWLTAIYVVAVGSVTAALMWRILRRHVAPAPLGRLAALGAALGAAAVVSLAALPHNAVAKHTAAATRLPSSLDVSFAGSISQLQGSSGSLVSVVGKGTGARQIALRIDLATTDGRTYSGTSLQLKDSVTGSMCTGTIGTIGVDGFSGTCSFPQGPSRTVTGTWTVSSSRRVTGSVAMRS
jgi:sulfoxide reductase heme-binding subunit YedZ